MKMTTQFGIRTVAGLLLAFGAVPLAMGRAAPVPCIYSPELQVLCLQR